MRLRWKIRSAQLVTYSGGQVFSGTVTQRHLDVDSIQEFEEIVLVQSLVEYHVSIIVTNSVSIFSYSVVCHNR